MDRGLGRLDLHEVMRACKGFLNGGLDRDGLEAFLADRVMNIERVMSVEGTARDLAGDDERAPVTESQALAYRIAERICATERKGEDFDALVRRVLTCIDQVEDPEKVIGLLPFIVHHDEFSTLVAKYQKGIISRTGFSSIVGKRFAWDRHWEWLDTANVESFRKMGEMIEADDFAGLHRLLEPE